jgi:adenylate kinase
MVLFGPPGSGKGSYCKMFAKDLNLSAFSSGDFFRKRLSKSEHDDPKLKEIEEKITKGGLVEDDLVNEIVHKKLIEAQGKGVILDGYPRTLK